MSSRISPVTTTPMAPTSTMLHAPTMAPAPAVVPAPAVPDLDTLTKALARVLCLASRDVVIRHRRPNIQTSTFPSEVLTCRLRGDTEVRLFIKYSSPAGKHLFGHRSGVPFEARVYRDILSELPLSSVRYYGHDDDGDSGGRMWLVLEALDEIARVSKSPTARTEGLAKAAEWIGRFHALGESRVSRHSGWLHRYDAAYLSGWCRRTAQFAGHWHDTFPWIGEVCRRCETFLPEALSCRPTIIHGEYYPANILLRDGVIYPVDWESAAVAAGEIDFASLTQSWPDDTVQQCRARYLAARWPDGTPDDFDRTLKAAELYLHFRWLGNRAEWTQAPRHRATFARVQMLATELGLAP